MAYSPQHRKKNKKGHDGQHARAIRHVQVYSPSAWPDSLHRMPYSAFPEVLPLQLGLLGNQLTTCTTVQLHGVRREAQTVVLEENQFSCLLLSRRLG